MSGVRAERERAWRDEARRRAARMGGESAEDAIVRALLAGALAEAARAHAAAELLDHDYVAYWVDELELREAWSRLA